MTVSEGTSRNRYYTDEDNGTAPDIVIDASTIAQTPTTPVVRWWTVVVVVVHTTLTVRTLI